MSKNEKNLIKTLLGQFNLSPRIVIQDWKTVTESHVNGISDTDAFMFLQFCYRENNSMLAKYNFGIMRK
jgi:hypothetical protein